MAFARTHSAQIDLLSGKIVTVEVDTSGGLNSFTIVGLGDRAVDEARDRVGSALKNAGFESPKHKNQKTVVSLSPADVKKEGSHFDLPIALGYLSAEGIEMHDMSSAVFIGELGLDGSVRPVRGTLAIALAAAENGFKEIFVPEANADEAALVESLVVFPVKRLRDVVDHFLPEKIRIAPYLRSSILENEPAVETDFSDVVGQDSAKRGLLIAAAGGHNVLMYGPPGSGKTMLARALAGILPMLSDEHAIEVTSIHSIAGTAQSLKRIPPFRAPHHTASYVSVIGGGTFPKPGEVTLAHRGVLFLDEFPEFDRRVIESLREPLEEKYVSISRAKGTAVFPTHFLFVAAMNPCPCGYRGSKVKQCTCTAADLVRYKRKLSGPLLDRIDMALYVGEIPYEKLSAGGAVPESHNIREKIMRVRERMTARTHATGGIPKINGELHARELPLVAPLSPEASAILNESAERLGLSARSYHRTQKLARTIADLDDSEHIKPEHILEAIRYRPNIDSII